MWNVIISGASGYFGSLAKKHLESSGCTVFSAGRNKHADYFFDLDCSKEFADTKVRRDVDVFIHAAATHEVDCVNDPYKCIFRNVAGTRAALEFCVKNNIQKFIYVSTFHVYGVDKGDISESTETTPVHDYGLTHLLAEEYVRMYTSRGLVQGVCIRPSNMFDPPVSFEGFNRWSLIPFGFCKSAVSGGCIKLKSAGFQQRNFVSVKDIVSIIIKITQNELRNEVINIPGISTYSIRDFADLVRDIMLKNFNKSVDVIVPNGKRIDAQLIYRSNFFEPSIYEFSTIETHVESFCRKLVESS